MRVGVREMAGKHFGNPYSGTQGYMVDKYYDGIKKQNEKREAKKKLQNADDSVKTTEAMNVKATETEEEIIRIGHVHSSVAFYFICWRWCL